MSNTVSIDTKPEDKIAFAQKVIYGFGALANNLLGAAIGMITAGLMSLAFMGFTGLIKL